MSATQQVIEYVVWDFLRNTVCTSISNADQCKGYVTHSKWIYDTYIANLGTQAIYSIALGLYAVAMGMLLVVWDWLPLSFRLLFMGKPADYDWN